MKILLWVAELVVALLRSKQQDMAKTVSDMTKGYYDYEVRLREMKNEQALYEDTLKSIKFKNELLQEKIKAYRHMLEGYESENDAMSREHINKIMEMAKNQKELIDV